MKIFKAISVKFKDLGCALRALLGIGTKEHEFAWVDEAGFFDSPASAGSWIARRSIPTGLLLCGRGVLDE
jgi:hypothetical protein